MFEAVRQDIKRSVLIESGSLRVLSVKSIGRFMYYYGLQTLLIYRFHQWIEKTFAHPLLTPLRWVFHLVYLVLERLVRAAYGIRISPKAEIGPGLYIGHFGGIHIGRCRIGKNCSIHQQTFIDSGEAEDGLLEIGDRVWIGSHSRLTGPLKIASGVTVSAGAVVTENVNENRLVMGAPVARVIHQNYDNNKMLKIQAEA